MLTKEELDQINRFSKAELTADQVYTFSVRLCDNEVDRDFERFGTEDLDRLGELFLGKSGIFDHQWSAKGQTARIYRTEVVREPGTVTAADYMGKRCRAESFTAVSYTHLTLPTNREV